MPTWVKTKTTKDKIALALSWLFVGLIILAVMLSANNERPADPMYPVLWNEFSNDLIRFDYPSNFEHVKTVEDNIIESINIETYVFSLTGTGATITVDVIYDTELNDFIGRMSLFENPRNTVFVPENDEIEKAGGYIFEYDSDKIENKYVVVSGIFFDDRAEDNMRRIVERMGNSLRRARTK